MSEENLNSIMIMQKKDGSRINENKLLSLRKQHYMAKYGRNSLVDQLLMNNHSR